MRLLFTIIFLAAASTVPAQTRPKSSAIPAGVPVKDRSLEALGGAVEGRSYRNQKFGIELTVENDWYIAGEDFEKIAKDKGHDLSLSQAGASRSLDVLMTAFRSDAAAGAVLRVVTEDLDRHPQIRDAVDYLDAVTAAYASAKLPADFSYSTTKAEKLGTRQFAYLDTASRSGKKRMYAAVRGRTALLYVLSYSRGEDLEALRRMLASSEFKGKS